jgi:hypothetical protein
MSLVTLKMEAICSSEMPVLTRAATVQYLKIQSLAAIVVLNSFIR